MDCGVEKLIDKIKDEDIKKVVDGLLKGLFNWWLCIVNELKRVEF